MTTKYVKARYLDASAIIKIYIDESGSDVVREYFRTALFTTTSLCVMEALGKIKAKWTNKHISEEQYYNFTGDLLTHVWSEKIEVKEVNLFTMQWKMEVEKMAKKYSLDWSDALQIVSILKGEYRAFADECKTILITADEGLANAAIKEGIRAWNILKNPKPDWA
jgi:predicted nucleic acid-binding protein